MAQIFLKKIVYKIINVSNLNPKTRLPNFNLSFFFRIQRKNSFLPKFSEEQKLWGEKIARKQTDFSNMASVLFCTFVLHIGWLSKFSVVIATN